MLQNDSLSQGLMVWDTLSIFTFETLEELDQGIFVELPISAELEVKANQVFAFRAHTSKADCNFNDPFFATAESEFCHCIDRQPEVSKVAWQLLRQVLCIKFDGRLLAEAFRRQALYALHYLFF